MNQMGGGGFYIAIFSTVLPTDHLLLSMVSRGARRRLATTKARVVPPV